MILGLVNAIFLASSFMIKSTYLLLYLSHGKGNDHVSLFDECVVQIAAVHAGIGGGADCAGRGIQTVDFGDHVAVGCGG